jgi:hypothetical protein
VRKLCCVHTLVVQQTLEYCEPLFLPDPVWQ